jgi:hypothetical protein
MFEEVTQFFYENARKCGPEINQPLDDLKKPRSNFHEIIP